MPRKSRRTATTTYRRKQLMWDDVESSDVNRNHGNYSILSKVASVAKTISDRLVTPSPRVVSTANTSEKNESPQKISPQRKQLFAKKKSSKRKPISSAIAPVRVSVLSEKLSTSSPKRLFPGASSSAKHNADTNITPRTGSKGMVPKKRSFDMATKGGASKERLGKRHRKKFTSGDSLATFISIKKTLPSARNNTVCTINDKSDRRKGSQRYPIGTTTKGEVLNETSKRFYNSRNYFSATKKTSQHGDVEMIEKNCISSIDKDNKMVIMKNKKSVPAELISLLASRTRKRNKRIIARSTIEILAEFNKNKKELKLKEASRASLPRACKNSKKFGLKECVTDEDTDGESEQENKNDNDNNDRTTNKTVLQMNDPSREEESRKESTATVRSSTKETFASTTVSPLTSTLKPRPRQLLSSSNFDGIQSLSLLAPPSVNDDGEYERVSKKRRNSNCRNEGSCQHTKVDILSPKVNRPKNHFAISTNPDPRMTEDPSENACHKTSQLDSHEQVSIYSKRNRRRRLQHVTNDFDIPKSRIPPSNTIANDKLSPTQCPQELWTIASMPSYRRRKQHKNQFSMEEYSLYSSHSNNGKAVHSANPSRRSITIEDSDIEAIGGSSKNSNNLSVLRRETQELKSQAYSNSPIKLASVSNEESRIRESPTRAKHNLGASPQRKKEQQQLIPRKLDKEVANSKKRVRFDSSTTTFSVKIKIKTNLDRQSKNGSEYSQSVSLAPSLNESAVQAIANQVTQACLTQARTSAGTGNGDIVRTCGDPDVNVNVDVNEEGEFSSHSSESSSNSNQSSDVEEESGDGKRKNEFLHDMLGERDASIVDARREISYLLRKNFDDGRSITSELTSDWNRQRPSRFNDQDYLEEEEKKNVGLVSKQNSVRDNFLWKDKHGTHQGPKNINGIEKIHFTKNSYHHGGPSVSNTMRSFRAISNTNKCGETRSNSSVSRRQRMRGCSDSLAGSCFGSISSVAGGRTSSKIPKEVSLHQPSIRSTGWSPSRNDLNKRKYASSFFCVGDDANKKKRPGRSDVREVENTRVIPIAPNTSRKSLVVPFLSTDRCGKCKGCRRTFDCQTCDTCLKKLRLYGSPRSSSMKEEHSLCLSRRCQRTCRVGFVDSLLGLKPSFNPLQSNHPADDKEEQSNALSTDKSLSYRNAVKNSRGTNDRAVQNSEAYASKTMKAPWDEGDDWTVDYSYLSEPEYRRHWGKIINSTDSKIRSLSTRSLSTPSWWLPVNEKQTIAGFGGGGRTILSSVSESVVSQKRLKRMITPVSGSNSKHMKGKRRGGKRKRDPLHGLALPSISTDAVSVTSWRANRKCLRALMEYDEGDQDWV
jgi:hypothetical protein